MLSEWGFAVGCLHALVAVTACAEVTRQPYDADDAGIALLVAIGITGLLAVSLAIHAHDSGYSRAWCLMALLSVVGVVVVHFLPDRTGRPAAGFPVLPYTPPDDDHGETVRPAPRPGRDG